MFVLRITKRTGNSKTSPRKIPMKTIRNVLPIAMKAPMTAIAPKTISSVLIGISSSTRFESRDSTERSLFLRWDV